MNASRAPSSFADEDWLPVLEELLRGTQHALNNRVAALGGALSLQELGLATADESLRALRDEVKRLRALLIEMRDLTPSLAPRREPAQMSDALAAASGLLAHGADARQVNVAPTGEGDAAEPAMLWPADSVRAAMLLLGCASDAAEPTCVLQARVRGDGHRVLVIVEGQFKASEAERSATYQSLVRFAAAESGHISSEGLGAEGARLTLTLPGMSQSR